MGLIEKIQNSYLFTHWKVRKYTKRRNGCYELDHRDAKYYKRNYSDGVYQNEDLSSFGSVPPRQNFQMIRSSEAYNDI
ncbi:hypothetical protein K7432_015995 [Basidiobolus ranarum]|uniref:Uncharacterized protein n=1 Tax=Basidiobolus ranarum TaxID=34480 RepID=A0ABR2WFH6_9FUNG